MEKKGGSNTMLSALKLARKWKNSVDVTLETNVGAMNNIFERMDLACEYVTHTSLDNNNANQIWADLLGKGFDFQACCSLIVLVNPVGKQLMKNGTNCGFDAMIPAS